MKKKLISSVLLLISVFICVFCFLPSQSVTVSADLKTDNMLCNGFHYDISINENKVCDITETINITYKRPGINLGLTRFISKVDTVTRIVNGKEYTTRTIAGFELISVTMDGEKEYSYTEEDEEYYFIYTGADGDFKQGTHEYKLHYTYDLGEDFINEFDDFTFDILPQSMECDIAEFSANITFPKNIDVNQISFRTNNKSQIGAEALNFQYDESTYTISVNYEKVRAGTVFTIQTLLPQGYFQTSFTPNSVYYLIVVAIITALALTLLALSITYLKNRCIPVVEFYPPNGMNPIDVAKIYRRKVKSKDFAALVINWAGQGLVSIKFVSKTHIILTKLKDFPEATSKSQKHEKAYFDAIFKNGDTYDTATDKSNKSAISKAASSLYDIKDSTNKQQNLIKFLISMIACIPLLVYIIWICSLTGFTFVYFFFLIFPLIAVNVFVHTPIPLWFKIIWCGGFGGAPLGILLTLYSFSYDIYSLGIIASVVMLVCTLLSKFVKLYPKEDKKLRGQIIGFKNYLVKAELSKLEMQLSQDPEYFYKILPYCYVFGITKKMEKRFAALKVAPPDYMEGYSYFYFGFFMGRSMHSIGAPRISSGHVSSLGGSGGGFGGSSGGGSGGGGMRGR